MRKRNTASAVADLQTACVPTKARKHHAFPSVSKVLVKPFSKRSRETPVFGSTSLVEPKQHFFTSFKLKQKFLGNSDKLVIHNDPLFDFYDGENDYEAGSVSPTTISEEASGFKESFESYIQTLLL